MPRLLPLTKAEVYYKHKKIIPRVIMSATEKKETIYGAQALNIQLPSHLRKQTEDYDIFSPTPKKSATETEKALDKAFKGNYFYVEPAKHPGTFKVKSRVTLSGVADYTKPEQRIPYRTIGGRRYVKLSYVKKHIAKTLKDPEAKFRWEKDKEALQRIKIYEQLKQAKIMARRKAKKDDFGFSLRDINF